VAVNTTTNHLQDQDSWDYLKMHKGNSSKIKSINHHKVKLSHRALLATPLKGRKERVKKIKPSSLAYTSMVGFIRFSKQ
jgi:hypothetical protein